MDASYDGRQVVAIDLHRRRSVIVRMTEDGRKLETVWITNSPAALRREIAKAGGGHVRLVLGRGRAGDRGRGGAPGPSAGGQGVHLTLPRGPGLSARGHPRQGRLRRRPGQPG
jgi:hypothetical protein